jgi:hypothetical protein
MPEVRLQRPGIDSVVGQFEAAGVAQHVMRLNPGGVIGAPRSDTKTNGDGGLSRR